MKRKFAKFAIIIIFIFTLFTQYFLIYQKNQFSYSLTYFFLVICIQFLLITMFILNIIKKKDSITVHNLEQNVSTNIENLEVTIDNNIYPIHNKEAIQADSEIIRLSNSYIEPVELSTSNQTLHPSHQENISEEIEKFDIQIIEEKPNPEKDEHNNFLKSLKQGDVVWAKMPQNTIELNCIEEGHQYRPYLIVSRKNEQDNENYIFIAYPCGSNRYSFWDPHDYCIFDKNIYHLQKEQSGYFWLNQFDELPGENILYLYTTLYPKTLWDIEKRIYIQNYHGNPMPYLHIPKRKAEQWDLIEFKNNKYLVIKNTDSVYKTYQVLSDKEISKYELIGEKFVTIHFSENTYYVLFDKKVNIPVNETIQFIQILGHKQIYKVEHAFQKNINMKHKKKKHKNNRHLFKFKYPMGQTFIQGNSLYLYLFHFNYKMYVTNIYLDEDKMIPFVACPQNLKISKKLEKYEALHYFNSLIIHGHDFQGFIEEMIKRYS